MKSFLIVLIFILATATSIYSQRNKKIDVVYLKSYEVLKGKITDSIPGVSITFQTLDQEFHFIPRADILKITTEMYIKPGSEIAATGNEYYANKESSSYWLWLQVGGGFSLSNSMKGIGKVDLVNGIRFENKLGVGLGIGSDFRPLTFKASESFILSNFKFRS